VKLPVKGPGARADADQEMAQQQISPRAATSLSREGRLLAKNHRAILKAADIARHELCQGQSITVPEASRAHRLAC